MNCRLLTWMRRLILVRKATCVIYTWVQVVSLKSVIYRARRKRSRHEWGDLFAFLTRSFRKTQPLIRDNRKDQIYARVNATRPKSRKDRSTCSTEQTLRRPKNEKRPDKKMIRRALQPREVRNCCYSPGDLGELVTL